MSTRVPGMKIDAKSKSAGSTPATRHRHVAEGDRLPDDGGIAGEGALPRRVRQQHGARPVGRQFLGVKVRPLAGCTPSSSKKRGPTGTPTSRSASPRPVSV